MVCGVAGWSDSMVVGGLYGGSGSLQMGEDKPKHVMLMHEARYRDIFTRCFTVAQALFYIDFHIYYLKSFIICLEQANFF